ncbi:ankyrin repeat protein [Leptospira kirschneri serovar Cynopteri str. 3522 CT]|nr:ankyrin repeat protein [Leptospira kirschneri serovar Cynopteri str. 3522 CT]
MLDKLVELGLKVEDEKPDERGKTLLMAAVELSLGAYQNKNLIAHWLLGKGADVSSAYEYGMTVLHYACHHGDLDMIQTCLLQGAIQMSKSHAKDRKKIIDALRKVSKEEVKSPMNLWVDGSGVRLEGSNRKAILEHMLEITVDLHVNVFSDPGYDDPDHNQPHKYLDLNIKSVGITTNPRVSTPQRDP